MVTSGAFLGWKAWSLWGLERLPQILPPTEVAASVAKAPGSTPAGDESTGVSASGAGAAESSPVGPAVPKGPRWTGPVVAVILDDAGLDMDLVRRVLAETPPEVAVAVIPGTPHDQEASRLVHEAGRDLFCHLPMEPLDPKPGVGDVEGIVRTDMTRSEIQQLVAWSLDRVPDAVGLNNHMGSRATADRRVMEITLAEVLRRNLVFVDSRTSGRTVAEDVARNLGVITARRDVFLDDKPDREAVRRQVRQLGHEARRNGRALGIGHVRAETVDVLAPELTRLVEQGIRLVSLSRYLDRESSSSERKEMTP